MLCSNRAVVNMSPPRVLKLQGLAQALPSLLPVGSLFQYTIVLLAWCVGAAATARNWSNRPSGCRNQAAGTGTEIDH